jgi:D-proline reductase (dithiol) PrdB
MIDEEEVRTEALHTLRERIREQHEPDFDFRTMAQVPFVPFTKLVREARVALVSTAGLCLPEHQPFDRVTHSGDSSFREVAGDADVTQLRLWWDKEGTQFATQDLNCAFPLPLLHELQTAGEIGSVAATHYSFSGSIPDPEPLLDDYAPAMAAALIRDAVDAVLVAPS